MIYRHPKKRRNTILQVDNRDQLRPLVYMGRILEGQMAAAPLKECVWKSSQLLKEGRTSPANQIPTKEMLAPDLGDNLLPGNVEEGEIQGGRRVGQIGQSGCERLLESLLDNLEIPARGMVFVYDLNVKVPEMFQAFVSKKESYNFPMVYIGCTDSATTHEWFHAFATVSWYLISSSDFVVSF